MEDFKCENCGKLVKVQAVGTKHRNHCLFCLWSKHLDDKVPGDRASTCLGLLKPIGLTFKKEADSKGELMIVHQCVKCGAVEKNRIAGDDDEKILLSVFENGKKLNEDFSGIVVAKDSDEFEVLAQLFGIPEARKRLNK